MSWKFVMLVAVLAAFGLAPAASQAPEPKATGAARQAVPANLSEEERVRRWLAYNRPGVAHRRLEAFIGEWDTMWRVWDSPGAAPDTVRGTASFAWLHGGRYIRGDYRGSAIGRRYEAQLQIGFDAFREQYVAMWTNSLETAPLVYRGGGRVDGNARFAGLELRGKGDDCVNGRFDLDYRAVFAIEPGGTIRESIYGPDEAGREYLAAEIVYTRRQGRTARG